jgi:hypothetical protein
VRRRVDAANDGMHLDVHIERVRSARRVFWFFVKNQSNLYHPRLSSARSSARSSTTT